MSTKFKSSDELEESSRAENEVQGRGSMCMMGDTLNRDRKWCFFEVANERNLKLLILELTWSNCQGPPKKLL